MFSLRRPSASSLASLLAEARSLPESYSGPLGTKDGRQALPSLRGYAIDHTRTQIGRGHAAFAAAKTAFRNWQHFDLGWVRVANPQVKIEPGALVAVQAHSLRLWSINISRILYVIDEPNRFGFGYGTTPLHIERGEERFLLEYDAPSEAVHYDLLAISQPAHWMAFLAYPYTRSQQKRFALESHQKMRRAVLTFHRPIDSSSFSS